jgi:serine/threonine protein kinase
MTYLIGKTLADRYRVEAFLGKGGMAEVYKVWDTSRGVYLAMKLLHEDLALDNVFVRRFKREAQTLERLQHPNIVRFYGMEQEGRQVFILMEYIEGETLKHKIFDARGPLPIDQVLFYLRPFCLALQYAHNEGMVHADIKPGNIMIDHGGRVLLSDFGIARMTESTTVTMVGAGTPAYMAPEQARGKMPTPRTDIYSLGIVLYEMLTGERPFTGELATKSGTTSEKIRWEQVHLNPTSPRRFNHQISEELEAVVLKCLEKTPDRRFASVQELLNALEQTVPKPDIAKPEIVKEKPVEKVVEYLQPAEPIRKEPPSPPQPEKVQERSPRGRRWGLVIWVALAALATLVVFLGFSGVFKPRHPGISIDSTFAYFGEQKLGVSYPEKTFLVSNTGNADLRIGSLVVSGEFSLSYDSCSGQTIPENENCSFAVVFQPTSAGTKTGMVSVPGNARTSPDTIGLNGIAIVPPCRVALYMAESGHPTWIADIKNKLEGSGLFSTVDTFFADTDPTPTSNSLKQYQTVLVSSDSYFHDPAALGDVLAEYVDQGGGVVVSVFSFNLSAGSIGISGRLVSGGYLPFTQNDQNQGKLLTMVKDLSSHPILNGVNSFTGGISSYHDMVSLANGSTLLAHWDNGVPLVAIKQLASGRIVGLNFYPVSSDAGDDFWDASTDGARLLGNALAWAGQCSMSR